MGFVDYVLEEGIEPRKPSGKLVKKRVVKNRGMVTQKELEQVEFVTAAGNNVKVQFQIRDGIGDVVFYVNDTLDDDGGRDVGSIDNEILSGVLWVVDTYADRMHLNGLTFSAWAGKGDNKVVRGVDLKKPQEMALNAIKAYMAKISEYKPKLIPPTPGRIALARKMGREPIPVYDVDVAKVLEILGKIIEKMGKSDVMVVGDVREFEEVLWREFNGKKLDDMVPGAENLFKVLKNYTVALLSHGESGTLVNRNRRQDLYKRLMDKFFSVKWNIEQKGNSFTLTRKNINEGFMAERVSLDTKRNFIHGWVEESVGKLRSGDFFICDGLKMPFGKFWGVKVVGKYNHDEGIKNNYYFGRVEDSNGETPRNATGRAWVNDRIGTVWVASYGMWESVESVLKQIDGFQGHASTVSGFDAGGVVFAFSEDEKKVFYHELSHIYDMMVRGTSVGVSNTKNRWSTRPEEIEAELNAVYNSMMEDDTLTLEDFDTTFTPDHYGIGAVDSRYNTMVGVMYGWANNHPGKVKISDKKIMRRWVDIRQMVINKLKQKNEGKKSKFSDMMNEMPAWKDGDKKISDYMGERTRKYVDDMHLSRRGEILEEFKVNGLPAVIYRNHEQNKLHVHIFVNDKEVAGFHWWKEGKKPWATSSASVATEYQGKGIAYTVYTYMIDKYMHTLMSDETLTGETGKGSFDIWVKLGKKYPFKYIYNTSSRRYRQVQEFTRDMMDDEVKRFVVSEYKI